MKKTHTASRTNKHQTSLKAYVPLVTVGYILFAALVVATLLSTTIPFGLALFHPRAMHFNIAVATISLTVGAIVPVVVGYFVGDRAVKSTSKLQHHFSGILFGLLGFWLMIIVPPLAFIPESVFGPNPNVRMALMNIIPSVLVAIVTSILAVAHVHGSKARASIVTFKPFMVLLVLSIFSLPIWGLVSDVLSGMIGAYSFILIGLTVLFGVASFLSLYKIKLGADEKLTWSAVSVSVLFTAWFVFTQLTSVISSYVVSMPTMEVQAIESWLAIGLALAVWLAYWVWQVKSLRVSSR